MVLNLKKKHRDTFTFTMEPNDGFNMWPLIYWGKMPHTNRIVDWMGPRVM